VCCDRRNNENSGFLKKRGSASMAWVRRSVLKLLGNAWRLNLFMILVNLLSA
jgi:hypothetical protein